jgi:hypothetical protein
LPRPAPGWPCWATEDGCGPAERAYAEGLDGLIRVAPFSAALGASRLVRVQLLEPMPRDDTVVLPLRWEATGVAGRLFPVQDADLVLSRMLGLADAGKSLVLATHDPEVAQRCDRVVDLGGLRADPLGRSGLATG